MSMYRGKLKFDRAQIEYVAWCILAAVVDQIEDALPTSISYQERQKHFGDSLLDGATVQDLSAYERGAVDGAGMALSIFYAQLTGGGMGAGDALLAADDFLDAVEKMVHKSWENEGKAVFAVLEQRRRQAGSFQIADVIPGWPDCDKHAKSFANGVLEDYGALPLPDDGAALPVVDGTITFTDGSYLEEPTLEDNTIRRRDEQGNFLDARDPEDEGYSEWADLFGFKQTVEGQVSAYAERLVAAGDMQSFHDVFDSDDPNFDVKTLTIQRLLEIYWEYIVD